MSRGESRWTARDVEDLLQDAWQYLDAGNFAEGRELARKAAAAQPALAEPWLLNAECAGGEGDLKEAIESARKAIDLTTSVEDRAIAMMLKARFELAAGDVAAARQTLDAAAPALASGELWLKAEAADLRLDAGDVAAARDIYERLTAAYPDEPDAWYGLGMAAERAGDEKAKIAAWRKSLALEAAMPFDEDSAHLSEAGLGEVAEEALADLPARAQALLKNVPIIVADLPSAADVAEGLDPRLLGLFTGTPYPDIANVGGAAPHLTQILLFRRNLERIAENEDQLRDEIRTTLIHETGHFFGMDEDDLKAVGLD